MPELQPYGTYRSPAGQVKASMIVLGPVKIWYSSRIPIAFQINNRRIYVRRNIWGRATSRHMWWIDRGRRRNRLSQADFQREWDRQVEPLMERISNARTVRRQRSSY